MNEIEAVNYLAEESDTTPSDWTVVATKFVNHDKRLVTMMQFTHTKRNESYWVVDHSNGDLAYYPAGPYGFALTYYDSELNMAIYPIANPSWDQELGFIFELLYNVPDWIEWDEVCEGSLVLTKPLGKTINDVRNAFIELGLIWDEDFPW